MSTPRLFARLGQRGASLLHVWGGPPKACHRPCKRQTCAVGRGLCVWAKQRNQDPSLDRPLAQGSRRPLAQGSRRPRAQGSCRPLAQGSALQTTNMCSWNREVFCAASASSRECPCSLTFMLVRHSCVGALSPTAFPPCRPVRPRRPRRLLPSLPRVAPRVGLGRQGKRLLLQALQASHESLCRLLNGTQNRPARNSSSYENSVSI